MSELQEPPPEVGAPRRSAPSRDALRTLARCPTCHKESQIRNLAYKHRCRTAKSEEDLEVSRQARLKQLRARVMRRLATTTTGEDERTSPLDIEIV